MKILNTLLFYLFCTASHSAFACDRTFTIASHDAFWPPYVMGMSDIFKGTEVEALNIIFKDSPFCFKVELLPNSKRAFTELKHGRIDIGWAASYTDARAEYVYFTDSYRTEVMRLYENKSNPHNIKNLANIFEQGLTVGANFGSYYGKEFEQYKKRYKKQIEYTSSASKRFELLNKKRIDFAIEDSLVGAFFSKRSANLQLVDDIKFVNKDPIHLMLSKKTVSAEEVAVISQHIKSNKAALDALFK